MINKFFSVLFIAVFTLFSVLIPAKAQVQSESDIYNKKNQLQTILNTDFMSFINKTEVIGSRLDSFMTDCQYYKNIIYGVIEKLNNALTQIQVINNSQDLSNTDKEMQINKIYQEVDIDLYDLDSKTINFVVGCRRNMPSITYQRFNKKFFLFYNQFHFTNSVTYGY